MHRHKPLIHHLILAFLVATGVEVSWGLAASFVEETLGREQAWLEVAKEPSRTARGILIRNQAQIHVQSDGTVCVSGDSYRAEEAFYDSELQPRKLSGNERWVIAAALREPLRPYERNGGLTWRERLTKIGSCPPRQAWYFVHDGRPESRGYFVGYDVASKRLLGNIGKRGFSPETPPRDEQFEGDGRRLWGVNEVLRGQKDGRRSYPGGVQVHAAESLLPESVQFLLAGGRLWKIDLAGRNAAPLTEDEGIVSFDIVHMPRDANGSTAAGQATLESAGLVVRTPTTVKLLDLDGQQKLTWSIPDELRSEAIRWFVLDDGGAMVKWTQRQSDGPSWWQMQLARIDRHGAISHKQSFELFHYARYRSSWSLVAVVPVPAFFVSSLSVMYWSYSASMQSDRVSYAMDIAKMLAENWGVLAALVAASALLAVLAYRRQMRFAQPGAGAWATFVFLFGAPGWLAYRCHRHWPVLEACGECRRPAPRDRESCAACGSVFAPPPPTGAEIFA